MKVQAESFILHFSQTVLLPRCPMAWSAQRFCSGIAILVSGLDFFLNYKYISTISSVDTFIPVGRCCKPLSGLTSPGGSNAMPETVPEHHFLDKLMK